MSNVVQSSAPIPSIPGGPQAVTPLDRPTADDVSRPVMEFALVGDRLYGIERDGTVHVFRRDSAAQLNAHHRAIPTLRAMFRRARARIWTAGEHRAL